MERRTTFNTQAERYDRARPGYPDAMFDAIGAYAGLAHGAAVLELGCGTGQATRSLAQRGYRVTCVEPGEALAAVARDRLAGFPVTIQVGPFEQAAVSEGAFDLVFSATAFHWIDPAVSYRKSAQALRPVGTLALCWNNHTFTPHSQGFFEAVQQVYAAEVPHWASNYRGLPQPEETGLKEAASIEQSGYFGPATLLRFPWLATYTTQQFTDLLQTYSDHLLLPDGVRARLLGGIADLIEREYSGEIVKGYTTILCLAHPTPDE